MSLIIDSQVHIWIAESDDRRWPAAGPVQARTVHGRLEYLSEALLAEMDAAGVDRAVLVPPFFEGFRNDCGLSVVDDHPDRFRVMARVDLRDPESPATVAALLHDPRIIGLRFVFLLVDLGQLDAYVDHPVWSQLVAAR